MALLKFSDYVAALTTLKGLVDFNRSAEGARQAALDLDEAAVRLRSALSNALSRSNPVPLVASGANVAALLTVYETAKGDDAAVDDLFVLSVASDTDNDVLETAKAAPPAAGDVYRWTNVGAPALEFMGNVHGLAFGVTFNFF